MVSLGWNFAAAVIVCWLLWDAYRRADEEKREYSLRREAGVAIYYSLQRGMIFHEFPSVKHDGEWGKTSSFFIAEGEGYLWIEPKKDEKHVAVCIVPGDYVYAPDKEWVEKNKLLVISGLPVPKRG
jgi:hypothetical protein